MDGSVVYTKTPKGIAEIATRTAQLSMTSRRVLIMIDGKRTVDELAVLLRPGEIDSVITQLETGGLIHRHAALHASDFRMELTWRRRVDYCLNLGRNVRVPRG